MLFWDEEKQRRDFSIVTKRIEWLSAAKTDSAKRVLQKYVENGKVPSRIPRSKCRVCKKTLTWRDGTYNFDHYDNNSANNSQRNCYLVCRNCHGGATKTRVVRELDPWFGTVIRYITQKLKAGYKKNPRKAAGRTTKNMAGKTTRKPAIKTAKKSTSKTAKKVATKTSRKQAKKITRTKRKIS